MIIDTTLILSNQQPVTTSAASTNVIDLGTTGTIYGGTVPLTRELGHGKLIELAVSVGQSFAGLTSLQVAVQTSPDNATWTTVDSGAVIPAAKLLSGYLFGVPKVIQSANTRYLQLYYTVVGTATQGTINAEVVASRQTNINCGGV